MLYIDKNTKCGHQCRDVANSYTINMERYNRTATNLTKIFTCEKLEPVTAFFFLIKRISAIF